MATPKLKIIPILLLVTVIITILASTCKGRNLLYSRERLYPGKSLDEGSYSFKMQQTCNLVLYDGSEAIWMSNTASKRKCYAELLTDGNLVIRDKVDNLIWTSGTKQKRGTFFVLLLQEDRNVVIYGPNIWETHTGNMIVGEISRENATAVGQAGNVLRTPETLYAGQSLNEGPFSFKMQSTCNLVLYKNSQPIWTSNKGFPKSDCNAKMQTDGNFVLRSPPSSIPWFSDSWQGYAERFFVLVLQWDGNVVIYGPSFWRTDTSTKSVGGVVHTVVNGTFSEK